MVSFCPQISDDERYQPTVQGDPAGEGELSDSPGDEGGYKVTIPSYHCSPEGRGKILLVHKNDNHEV